MKRTTEVNRLLEKRHIIAHPKARTQKPSEFDSSFAAAMGEPDYVFEVETEPITTIVPTPGFGIPLKERI